MEKLHFQTQDSVARMHSQFPLFLHIFQNAQQLKQNGQLQTSCEELSATEVPQESHAHSAIASINLRRNHVNSAACSPRHASFDGCSTFSNNGFYLLSNAPCDPSFDDKINENFQFCSLNDPTIDFLCPALQSSNIEDSMFECRNSGFTFRDSITERTWAGNDRFNALTRLEVTDSLLDDRFSAPSSAARDFNLCAYSVGVGAMDREDQQHLSTPDDYSASMLQGDAAVVPPARSCDSTVDLQGANYFANFMQTEEVTSDISLTVGRDDLIGTHIAQEVSSVVGHVDMPSMTEQPISHGDLHAELNDAIFNAETDSLSYNQRWHMHFKGVSSSWQDLWRLQEETHYEHSAHFFQESDYGDVVSVVLNAAKCLPKNETLQEHLQPFSGRIDNLCGNAILYKLQKERLFLSALSFFDWMRLHTPCLLDSRSLCTIFTVLGDGSMVDRALILYDNLKHRKELWRVQVFNALLSALSKYHRYDEALAVFQEMSSMKIQPDSVTFCIMLNLAHKSGSKAEVLWQIFVDMESRKISAGHEVFGVLIKAFCQEGRRDEALRLLSMMEGRGLIPNIVIYNTLIGAFAKSGMLEEAEGLVLEMRRKGICMTVVTYNILIDAYGSTRNFEVAERILQGMLDKGPQPNVTSFTSLIAAYGRNFLSEKAASVFLRMRKNGVSPNTVAYTALIHAYAEDGWHTKAEFAFENMIREGFHPTIETYTSLLHAFRQASDLEKVKSLWKRMRRELNIGTRETFNVLMDACAKQGDYAEARNVMYEFKKIGYASDRRTYNMLINAYTRGGQHSKAPEIVEEMKKAGFSPDSFTYTTLIYSFLRVRDFSQAFYYHDKMCRNNQLPDKFTYKKLRALLDEKYEIKAERNMKAAIGAQREEHEVEKPKKRKSFRKKQTHCSSPIFRRGMRNRSFWDAQGSLNLVA